MIDLKFRFERLKNAVAGIGSSGNLSEIQGRLLSIICDGYGGDACGIYTIKGSKRLTLSASRGFPNSPALVKISLGDGAVGRAAQELETILCTDFSDPGCSSNGFDKTKSQICLPLFCDDERLGVVDVRSKEEDFFGEELTIELETLAAFYSVLIRSVTHHEHSRTELEMWKARTARLDLIHRVGATLVEHSGIEEAMQRVVDMLATTLNYSQAAILLIDNDLEELDLVCAYGFGDVSGLRIPLSQGATGYAASNAEPVNIADVTTDPRHVKGINHGRSELAVPIIFGDKVIGVLDVESPELGAFDEDDVETLTVVASYAAAAIRTSRLLAIIENRNGGE